MAKITTKILLGLQELLGLSSAELMFPVDVDMGNISLTLPVVPEVARRGLTIGPAGGWFQGVLENVHGAADAEVVSIDPYNPGDAAVGAYPRVVEDGFDIWLAGVSGQRSDGAGGLTMAGVFFNPGDASQGWGIDDSGATIVETPSLWLARFDSLETTMSIITTPPMMTEAGDFYVPLNLRLPRGGVLGFASESAAAADFQITLVMGLFPAALGQDIVT